MLSSSEILHGKILVVDDQEANILLLERMLRRAGYVAITTTMDPGAVCELHRENWYDLIVLDLQMPGMDGFQVMEGLKTIETGDYLPVLVITAQPDHKLRALQAGAKDFISKPFEQAEVLARVRNMLEVRLSHRELYNFNDVLEQRLRERTTDLQDGYLETIFTLTGAMGYKDEYTGAHAQRISYYSRELARMLGLDEEFIDKIVFASPLHDIGKLGIPDHLLLKAGGLTPEEWQVMKGHTLIGAKMLANSKSAYLRMGAEIALTHHERWDGSGYPDGKRGDAIPLAARITHLCDIYDALRSTRPHRAAYDHLQAIDIIVRGDGRTAPAHFDPVILAAFKKNHQAFDDLFNAHFGMHVDGT